jgi:cytosine/adenosine deaminase-related metal-dependent hydrolase
MSFLLKNLRWNNGEENVFGNLFIDGRSCTIHSDTPAAPAEIIECSDAFVYPGLINAHDHLEMNLYPRLGSPPYKNYVAWANDIYKPEQTPLKEIEKVAIEDRLLWGGLKNLIAGVTTVVHHNPWHRLLGNRDFPVHVPKDVAWAHSLAFTKKLKARFPEKKNIPFVIHAAEGVDELARKEVESLLELGVIGPRTVLVHGVGITESDLDSLKTLGASLIWCPSSNHYMFSTTAPINQIKFRLKVALGSDSTLTGSPTLLDEMKLALATGLADSREIFDMVTANPARIFSLPDPKIQSGMKPDLLVTKRKHDDYFINLQQILPEDAMMVVRNGDVAFSDREFFSSKNLRFECRIGSSCKGIRWDVMSLRKRISKKVPENILEKNPLWTLLT